jgi:succinate dehydrogenase/fumarate reductase iron-sulfur protein
MGHKETGLATIFRFDPGIDERPEYREYNVPYKGFTVLQVLQYIFENDDSTLSFRYGCDGSGPARCGACVLSVNREPVLACKKPAEKNMLINPHPEFQVIKDLIVDLNEEKERENG